MIVMAIIPQDTKSLWKQR